MSTTQKLRVHVVTEDDPLYVIQFFETFFDEYPRDELEMVGLTIQEAFNESKVATAKRIYSLYGPVDFGRLLFRVAERKLRGRSIAALAQEQGVTLLPTKSVNDADFVRRVVASKPDVIVSVAAPEIFRDQILQAAPLGCINLHSGRLPKYRGMMPTFWQMRLGEKEATVTVHEMAAELDAGAVLATKECPIHDRDSLDRVIIETKREAARLLIRTLRELAAGTTQPQPLDMAEASYYSFPTRSDAASFRKLGYRLL